MEVVRWYGAILKFQKENPPVMQQDNDPEYTSPPLNYKTKTKIEVLEWPSQKWHKCL